MPFDGLDSAKSAIETLGHKASQPDQKHLKAIADALGQAENRLLALEAVVRALALQVKPQNISPGGHINLDSHIRKLTSVKGY